MSMSLSPLDQPTQQHLRYLEQMEVRPTVSTRSQTALAEAQLEAYLNQINLHPKQMLQQNKNIF
jgi:hypothetical protein